MSVPSLFASLSASLVAVAPAASHARRNRSSWRGSFGTAALMFSGLYLPLVRELSGLC
jgi:hypothetical protein